MNLEQKIKAPPKRRQSPDSLVLPVEVKSLSPIKKQIPNNNWNSINKWEGNCLCIIVEQNFHIEKNIILICQCGRSNSNNRLVVFAYKNNNLMKIEKETRFEEEKVYQYVDRIYLFCTSYNNYIKKLTPIK